MTVVPDHVSRFAAMPSTMPTVFIVDDDISVREALEALIGSEGFAVKAFDSAQMFLAHTRDAVPSCLVLDVNLPGLNGLELQEQISADRAAVPIIFITGYGDVPMTVKAMKAGASEFLTKPFNDEVLLDAIRGAIERSRATIELEAELGEIRARYATLSPRELEVMGLVVLGLMNKQVGGKLDISEITVKAHRGRVMEKMKARSLADLVRMAAALGLPTGSASPQR